MVVLALVLGGCASDPSNPIDPHQGSNRKIDDFNAGLDKKYLKPTADAYTKTFPEFMRVSLGHAYDNVSYFDTVFNGLLQGKTDQALQDAARMGINSTIGFGGFLDVATRMGLKKHDEDFGLTLAAWGVEQREYLVLPLLGPTTGRDVWAMPVTIITNPLTWLGLPWAASIPVSAVRVVDYRTRYENEVKFRDQAALEPYIFTRDAYLRYRQQRVNGVDAPTTQPALDYFENEPDAAPSSPSTMPTSH